MTTHELHYYDDAFSIEKTRWGTFRSHDKEGKELVTSADEDVCLSATRWFLKARQDGLGTLPSDSSSGSVYSGEVSGKL